MGQQSALLARRQRQTRAARAALDTTFASPAEKSEHFRDLARKSHERRIVLSADEAEAIVSAYSLLGRIAARARLKLDGANPQETT